jgi:thiol-disulfide isomerase/thioredoxin
MQRPSGRWLNLPVPLLAAIVASGCTRAADRGETTAPADGRGPRAADAESIVSARGASASFAEGPIDLRPTDYAQLQRFLESHRGHPIVLDVWSTSCEPCVRELPNLAMLKRDYGGRGVVCATLNIDYTGAAGTTPEDARPEALALLEALDVNVHNFYFTAPDRKLFQQAAFKERGLYAPPAVLLFDASGAVVEAFTEAGEDGPLYERVRQAVDRLLETVPSIS